MTNDDQQPTTNDQRPTAEELKYSRDKAWRHRRPTNNLLEVWQFTGSLAGIVSVRDLGVFILKGLGPAETVFSFLKGLGP
jgi:hypothetical protein